MSAGANSARSEIETNLANILLRKVNGGIR
jgi:hypothetical protein